MIKSILTTGIVWLSLFIFNAKAQYNIVINSDSVNSFNNIFEIKKNANNQSEVIERISALFLEKPYVANTLIGSQNELESLVINFESVDCFTYIDYVLALAKTDNIYSFFKELVSTRYKNSDVTYFNRKHFFTDWYATLPQNANDITSKLSQNAITVVKNLNKKLNGEEYIKGLGVISRKITYIPTNFVDENVLDKIQTGDFIGIYSSISGLDVTHTGLLIKKNGQVFFRNASSLSKNKKVVDVPLLEYIKTKPGIVVLRTVIKK